MAAKVPGDTPTFSTGIMKAMIVAATAVALVGLGACGVSRSSSARPELGSGGVIARDAYLASIHRDVWFDGTDDNTLLRIGAAVCAGLDHDSPVQDIVGMAAANHIPPKQVRGLMRAAMKLCPQHQAAVEAYYTVSPLRDRTPRFPPDARLRNRSGPHGNVDGSGTASPLAGVV